MNDIIYVSFKCYTAGILNPWTGEPIHLSEDHDDNSAPDGKSHK